MDSLENASREAQEMLATVLTGGLPNDVEMSGDDDFETSNSNLLANHSNSNYGTNVRFEAITALYHIGNLFPDLSVHILNIALNHMSLDHGTIAMLSANKFLNCFKHLSTNCF